MNNDVPPLGHPAATSRALVAVLWLAVLALGAWWATGNLRVSGDLRAFMPEARSTDQRLLMDLLGDGPGARLLLVSLSGGDIDEVAERSRALREGLVDAPELVWIGNGDDALDDLPDTLHDYRYLLSDGPRDGSLSAASLTTGLRERLRDLASPAAAMVAPLLARDPTLETLRLLEAWTPAREPARHEGVWVSQDGTRALLLVQTRAPGFDPLGQQAALRRIRDVHASLDNSGEHGLEISGPGAFAERIAQRTRAEASLLGGIASVALLLLLAFAYRSVQLPLAGALPLASGVVAGLLATTAFFDQVHGITLAFGFTLLGVAQDYPVHLFSHSRPGTAAIATARRIWPTLAAGTGSSCLAYTVFLFAGVDGMRQLAVFTIAGLAVAALTTRYVLPRIMPPLRVDAADAAPPRWLQRMLPRRRASPWPAALLAGVALALIVFGPAPWWEDDLGSLTPVPSELLQRDRELRAELAAPDVRWLLVLQADDVEQVLQHSERLRPQLDALVADRAISGYDLAARYLPSIRTQRERQALLPSADVLRADLDAARSGLPFSDTAFQPFLDAVERARRAEPLQPEALQGTPLQLRVESLLRPSGAGALGLISLADMRDPAPLQALAEINPELHLLDLKSTAESLAGGWRTRLLWAMAAASLMLVLGIAWAVGDRHRALRVLLPVALGSLTLLAVLHAMAIPLTLFHLVSMVLAACLGVDYALFLEHAGEDDVAQRRTLHALAVCALSTLFVFALLATSQTPVLRAIGLTVSLGVLIQIVLASLLARRPPQPDAAG